MNIVVDTSVWSAVLRRRDVREDDPYVRAYRRHIENHDCLCLVGPVLQELLSGLRTPREFDLINQRLSLVPLLPLTGGVYITAARIANACRREGFQAGPIDYTIAAACVEHGHPLLTSDTHFLEIAQRCPLTILPPLESAGVAHAP